MKKLITILVAICMTMTMTFSLSACNKPTLDDGILTVGYTIYEPMNYFEADVFVGFDTELASEVGKILDVEIEFVEINWDNKVTALKTYEIDCVWNGMTITEELKKAMSITDPYLENKQVVICQKDVASQYASLSDISKAGTVLFEAGSAGESTAKSIEGLSESKCLSVSAQKDTIIEVKTDSSKIAIIDLTMAQVLVGEGSANSDLTYVDFGFELEQFGIGFRKNDTETMNKVNDAINELKENGKFDEIKAKYFS